MTADPGRVAAAQALLAQLGVSIADLQAAPSGARRMPTVGEYLPQVQAAASPASCRTYGSYWVRMVAAWGDWPLDAVAATDVEALQRECVKHARRRRNGRGGRHAGENLISAARAFFTRAIADGHVVPTTSPAHQVSKPRRLPSSRRALSPRELRRSTRWPAPAATMLSSTRCCCACTPRPPAAVAAPSHYDSADLDVGQGLMRLREKGETLRWQPITLDLAAGCTSTPSTVAQSCRRISCCATASARR